MLRREIKMVLYYNIGTMHAEAEAEPNRAPPK
jgi:hypothetical protein